MDITTYVQEVRRTCNIKDPKERLILAALGLAGESGEVIDLLKKHLYHAHNLDASALSKELGDILWYMVLLCETVGLTLEDVMQANVEKLQKRYPQGFDPQRSRERIEA